jgi:DNA-binding SARP family transcriptional activator
MALLKVLLCRANRRASRDELIEAIWPDPGEINAVHALDSAASVLRRHILRAGEVGSLLLTLRSGGETILKLAGQQRLWVDADALLSLVSQAMRAECQGQDPLPLLEEAHAIARGQFLEDDLYAAWAQPRRHTIDGVRHRVLFKLVDLYLSDERLVLAEELLFAALEEDPTDEDALCRLMVLLVEQERRQEALQLYQYTEDVLHEELAEPAVYTRELARRIRQGLVLRERGEGYTTMCRQARLLAEQGIVLGDRGEGSVVREARLVSAAAPSGGHTPFEHTQRVDAVPFEFVKKLVDMPVTAQEANECPGQRDTLPMLEHVVHCIGQRILQIVPVPWLDIHVGCDLLILLLCGLL